MGMSMTKRQAWRKAGNIRCQHFSDIFLHLGTSILLSFVVLLCIVSHVGNIYRICFIRMYVLAYFHEPYYLNGQAYLQYEGKYMNRYNMIVISIYNMKAPCG